MIPNHAKNILKQVWGYSSFREKQEEIVHAVLQGKDTLALLPTGGGKSICFQVPALCMEGVCLVITPLVALMNDQVENLKKKGIKALAVHSGMSRRQIDHAFDNVIYGDYKFLYLSPERLKTEMFKERLKKMNVSFVAVDEAHCISQWGYDFRPAYLEIAALRELLPNKTILALTATATPRVVEDIQDRLKFKDKHVIQKSFYRENLRYFVANDEQKTQKLLAIIKKQKGSGLVYLRSRKQTVEYAAMLRKQGISAEHYHAGLSFEQREKRQKDWQNNKIRIIVCTNAFGMGIDKPDVRFVVNMDLPESIEAYFQEAGRAGRDEKKAFAILVADEADKDKLLEKTINKFPDIDTIKRIYGLVMNHLRLALGAGEMESYVINWLDLEKSSDFDHKTLVHAASFIERAGYWQLSEGLKSSSEIMFTASPTAIYDLQVKYPQLNKIIQVFLRSYGGVFESYTSFREEVIAKRAGLSEKEVVSAFEMLQKMNMVDYKRMEKGTFITMLQPRIDIKYLRIPVEFYQQLRQVALDNMNAMITYAYATNRCRSVMLLNYFGENGAKNCGVCDYCLSLKERRMITSVDNKSIVEEIKELLVLEGGMSITELVDRGSSAKIKEGVKFAAHWMLDNGIVSVDERNVLILRSE